MLYIGHMGREAPEAATMCFEEKSAWIMLVVAVVGYAVYLFLVLGRGGDGPIHQLPYVAALLWTVGGAIVASIVLHIAVGVIFPEGAGKKDERDIEIGRFGEYSGQSFVVLGGVAALGMAMAELDHFWIANAIYLGFVLSAIVGSVARIFAYRRGFPSS
jgi:hypothetical protein